MRKLRIILSAIILLLLYTQNTFAATTQTISATNIPVSIDQSQEFEADVTFSCPSCSSDSYLRGVFYPSGSSYFGYTQDNNGNWSKKAAGDCTTYYKIAQSELSKEGNWNGKLKFKADTESTYYKGPGEYTFKIGRYTSSCSSPLWSMETIIAITGPTPTPTPTQTFTPTPTPTKIPTPTPTPTSTPTPTKIKTPPAMPAKKTPALLPSKLNSIKISILPSAVLGDSTSSAVKNSTISPTPKKVLVQDMKKLQVNPFPFAPVAIIVSGVLICACGILIYLKGRKNINS